MASTGGGDQRDGSEESDGADLRRAERVSAGPSACLRFSPSPSCSPPSRWSPPPRSSLGPAGLGVAGPGVLGDYRRRRRRTRRLRAPRSDRGRPPDRPAPRAEWITARRLRRRPRGDARGRGRRRRSQSDGRPRRRRQRCRRRRPPRLAARRLDAAPLAAGGRPGRGAPARARPAPDSGSARRDRAAPGARSGRDGGASGDPARRAPRRPDGGGPSRQSNPRVRAGRDRIPSWAYAVVGVALWILLLPAWVPATVGDRLYVAGGRRDADGTVARVRTAEREDSETRLRSPATPRVPPTGRRSSTGFRSSRWRTPRLVECEDEPAGGANAARTDPVETGAVSTEAVAAEIRGSRARPVGAWSPRRTCRPRTRRRPCSRPSRSARYPVGPRELTASHRGRGLGSRGRECRDRCR